MRTRYLSALLLLAMAGNAWADRIGIAAIVGDEIISTNDVAERRDLILATNNMAPTVDNYKRVTPKVVQSLIDESIELQEARRLSITIGQEDIDKGIAALEESRHMPVGSLRPSLKAQGLSVNSLENQFRAQLAWTKVVQRKLRREVSISDDEVARAQQAAAADPGIPQVKIAAISILMLKPEDEKAAADFASQIADKLRGGTPMTDLMMQLNGRKDVRISPPGWVDEEKLQPAMQQAIRAMKPGEVTPPLKSLNTYQLIQMMERRVAKRVPDSTEMVLKEIAIPVPPKPDQKTMLALRDQTDAVAKNPGDCSSDGVGVPGSTAQTKFTRLNYGALPDPLKPIVAQLEVTGVSQPIIGETYVRMYMLCERIDPGMGNLPPAAEVRRQLFNEKIELEAEKHLRNLKRDTFIDIKDQPVSAEQEEAAPTPQPKDDKPAAKVKPKPKAKKNG